MVTVKKTTPRVGGDAQQWGPSSIADRIVKWCCHFRKEFANSLKLNSWYDQLIPPLRITQETENLLLAAWGWEWEFRLIVKGHKGSWASQMVQQ